MSRIVGAGGLSHPQRMMPFLDSADAQVTEASLLVSESMQPDLGDKTRFHEVLTTPRGVHKDKHG